MSSNRQEEDGKFLLPLPSPRRDTGGLKKRPLATGGVIPLKNIRLTYYAMHNTNSIQTPPVGKRDVGEIRSFTLISIAFKKIRPGKSTTRGAFHKLIL